MSKKPLKKPVTLTLEADLVAWLRDFLYEESLSAEIDHENVESLHTDVAIRAAKIELNRVNAWLEKVIEALDNALDNALDDARNDARSDDMDVSDACKAVAEKIAAMTPPVA